MKLYLYGHDYKYAAEQMLLTLFPAQGRSIPPGPRRRGRTRWCSPCTGGAVWATATAARELWGTGIPGRPPDAGRRS